MTDYEVRVVMALERLAEAVERAYPKPEKAASSPDATAMLRDDPPAPALSLGRIQNIDEAKTPTRSLVTGLPITS